MLDPNAPKTVSSYERTENVLASLTPDPRDFEGRTYPAEDVKSDAKQLEYFRYTREYKESQERSDAKILEKTFTDMVEKGDWFGEGEAYIDDPDYLSLTTFPTSDIDDHFNHIDVIGMITNEMTGHETMPFAIDLTYNTDDEKMTKKFRWKHVYGKTEAVRKGISEFGDAYAVKDSSGQDELRTRQLPLKFRLGLKIPGFASAKYFEDKNNPWDPLYEKGRIDIMPRFIVGYSTDIANILAAGKPPADYVKLAGKPDFEQKKKEYEENPRVKEYENAERRAKWCTLLECRDQADHIRFMLDHLDDEKTKLMQPDELEKAKKQIAAMDDYFAKALEIAKEKAQTNEDEKAAWDYAASRDTVCEAIRSHSYDVYYVGNWQ